jgi:hypothetical protein
MKKLTLKLIIFLLASSSLPVFGQMSTTSTKGDDSLIQEFNVFWSKFRQAVIDNDTAKIKEYTVLPFKTRGPSDDDPIVEVNESSFIKTFKLFLDNRNGTPEQKTHFEIVKGIVQIEKLRYGPYTLLNNWARVDDLEFKKIGNQWKLYFAFIKLK